MTDRTDGSDQNTREDPPMRLLPIVITVLVAAALAAGFVMTADGTESKQFVDQSEEWCDERNGTLVNVLALGHHGGLHCELPNGTMVHMNEVIGPDD